MSSSCLGHRLDPAHGPANCAGCAAGLCERCDPCQGDDPELGDDTDAPDECLDCGRCAAGVERAKEAPDAE